jgi:hypothetical protein
MKVYRHGIAGMGSVSKDHIEGLQPLKGIEQTAI